jgi:hypothetical protein
MSMVGTVEGSADALDEFGGWQQASRLHHAPLAVHPAVSGRAATRERREAESRTGPLECCPEAPGARSPRAAVAALQGFLDQLLVGGLGEQGLLGLACQIDGLEVVHEGDSFESAMKPRWMCAAYAGVIGLTH